jgi:hypothetical protein
MGAAHPLQNFASAGTSLPQALQEMLSIVYFKVPHLPVVAFSI